MRSDIRRIGRKDRLEPVAKRRDIVTGLGLGNEPCVKLACATISAEAVAVLAHEKVGGIRVAEMIDQKSVSGGGGLPGHGGVRVGQLEEFPIETQGVQPLTRALGNFGGLEQEAGGFRGVGGEPQAGGGEGFSGALLLKAGFQQLGDIGFLLLGSGAEGYDALIQRRGGRPAESEWHDEQTERGAHLGFQQHHCVGIHHFSLSNRSNSSLSSRFNMPS